MAKYNGGLIGEIRGTVNGITYGNWHGVKTMRRKGVPVRRARTTQPPNRSRFGFLSRQYGVLDAADRLLWEAYSASHPVNDKFGNPIQLTGANWFQKLNQIQMIVQEAVDVVMTQPPVSDPIASIDTLTPSDGIADGSVVLTPTINGTGLAADFLQIQVAGPFTSPARQEIDAFFTDLASGAGNDASLTVSDLQVDAWFWFRMRYTTLNNRPTSWVYAQWQSPDVV